MITLNRRAESACRFGVLSARHARSALYGAARPQHSCCTGRTAKAEDTMFINSKVKGWRLYGRTINSDGSLTDLTLSALGGPRPNCDTWQPRVDCPAGQIATAIVASFDTSSEPRAWTGVALKCRTVSPTVAPAFP